MQEKSPLNIEQVKHYCQQFAGAQAANKGEPANILSYYLPNLTNLINTGPDKKFAYFKTSEPEQWRFSIRVTPARFLELTDQTGIKPARYMQRFHWVSIVDVNTVDADYLQELITWSYTKAFNSLSKKAQLNLHSKNSPDLNNPNEEANKTL